MNRHFYVMKKKEGVVIDDSLPPSFSDAKKYGPIISESMIQSLVQLQAIDCEKEGLMDIGKPEGYLERQVRGWMKRFERSKTDNVITPTSVERWLLEHLPETRIVHNDFKLNNLVFDASEPSKVNGVLDWELSTIGDPMTDVGATVFYWIQPTDPDLGITDVTNQKGLYNRGNLWKRML